MLALFGTWGTEANLAIRGYANAHRIPQLFVESSSAQFDDPAHFPWTMGFFATFRTEGLGYAKYLLQKRPDARIAELYDKSAGATAIPMAAMARSTPRSRRCSDPVPTCS